MLIVVTGTDEMLGSASKFPAFGYFREKVLLGNKSPTAVD
jgi:hypothetical protein